MLLCFLVKTDSGMDAFLETDLLSQKTSAGPSRDTPNILSLYLKAAIISVAIRKAISSDPKLDASQVFCHFENHMIGVFWQYIRIPV